MSTSHGTDAGWTTARLRPGHHLYEGTDGTWRCALPGNRFLRLRGPRRALLAAQELLQRAPEEPAAVDEPAVVAPLLAGMARRGLLCDRPGPDASRPGGALGTRTVRVDGEGALADLIADRLAGLGAVRRGPLDPDREDWRDVDVLVSISGWLPDTRWTLLQDSLAEHGVAWHRVYVEGTECVVGPCWRPGRTASYTETRARRLAAAAAPDELRALWAHLDSAAALPPVPWPDEGALTVVAGLVVADVLAFLRGGRVPSEGHQVRFDPTTLALHRHPVLPLPFGDVRPDADPVAVDSLVDARTGVITALLREPPVPGFPHAFVDYTADVAATEEWAPWVADAIAGGATLGDPERARTAAIGEAVERYCGNAVPDGLPFGSHAELTERGEAPLDPAAFALFSAEQYAARGFPFAPFTRDLPVSWSRGTDLRTGARVLVPAALTYLNTHRSRRVEEPPTAVQAFAGIATGPSPADAQRSALEEVLERDAVTLWWLTGAEARQLDVSADPLLRAVLGDPAFTHLAATFLAIPGSFGVPVVGVFLEDRARGVVGFGSACRATPAAAAAKALSEAFVTHSIARELSEPEGTFWSSVRAGRLRQEPYHPFRADRGYRAGFRADWRDLTVLDLNLQLYLDPTMQGEPLRRLREPRGGEVALAELPEVGPDDPLGSYVRLLAGHGLSPAAVDVTTSDVARTGLRVVRLVVPGLYQNAPAAFPLLGGRRLCTEPVAQGWLAHPPGSADLVREPLPFA